MPFQDPTRSYFPRPSTMLRLAGLGALAGGILWPVSLIALANSVAGCGTNVCAIDRGSIGLTALAPIGFTIGIVGLELRAPRMPGLGDLVGDLSVGTAAALFALSFLLGTIGFLGPGFLLLLIGCVIFGIVGYRSGSRPPMASALVGVGAGGMLGFLGGAALSGGTGSGLELPSIIALLMFSMGWGWLGVDLLMARPLVIPEPRRGR